MSYYKDSIDIHFEKNGASYYIFLVSFEIVFFIFYNMRLAITENYVVQEYQYYKLATLTLLLSSMAYFLFVALRRNSPVDLFTFLIISTIKKQIIIIMRSISQKYQGGRLFSKNLMITNCYMIFRDILFFLYPDYFIEADMVVVEELKQTGQGLEQYNWHWLTIIDGIICMSCQIAYFLMAKPVSHTIQLIKILCILIFLIIYVQVYQRIGSKPAVWSIYKYFTLLLSLIKVDLVLNLFYLATAVYFTYNYGYISPFIIIYLNYKSLVKQQLHNQKSNNLIIVDIVFLLMMLGVAFYAVYCIINRYEKGFFKYSIFRIIVELIKVFKALLILNAINCNYVYSKEMQDDLGNIKFSILVQEIISLALFIPILSLGRFMFLGFSLKKLDKIFNECISISSYKNMDGIYDINSNEEHLLPKEGDLSLALDKTQLLEVFNEKEIMGSLIKAVKTHQLLVPKNDAQFLHPVLREEEWIFTHNFLRLLMYRLETDNEIAREKRRSALQEDDKSGYIDINAKHLRTINDAYCDLVEEIAKECNPADDLEEESFNEDIAAVLMVVCQDAYYLPNMLRTIRLTQEFDKIKHLKINIDHIKVEIQEIIEKEKAFLGELTHQDKTESTLQNNYLDFLRLEDKLYFETIHIFGQNIFIFLKQIKIGNCQLYILSTNYQYLLIDFIRTHTPNIFISIESQLKQLLLKQRQQFFN